MHFLISAYISYSQYSITFVVIQGVQKSEIYHNVVQGDAEKLEYMSRPTKYIHACEHRNGGNLMFRRSTVALEKLLNSGCHRLYQLPEVLLRNGMPNFLHDRL